jgi:class 3 adenylate cyclase
MSERSTVPPRMVDGAPSTSPRRAPSFRLKVTLIASLLAAIPLLVVALIVENVNERALGDANREVLAIVAGNVSGVAEGLIERADTTLGTISDQLADASLDVDHRIRLAQAALDGSSVVASAGVYGADGKRIDLFHKGAAHAPPLPETLARDLIAPAQPRFGAVAFTDNKAFIARAVAVNGEAETWTVVAQVSLQPLAERVAELGLTSIPGHALFVVDTSLQIVADTGGERAGRPITTKDAGILAGIQGRALDEGVLLVGEFTRADGESMLGEVRTIERTPLAVVVEVPRQQVYHSISAVRRIVLIATAVALTIAVLAGVMLARQVTKPIQSLVAFADDLANRRFERRLPHKTRDEIGVLGEALEAAATELAASDERIRREVAIRSDLGRYLPIKLVDQIVAREREVTLGGERREVTVLFADVVGFTPLAEREPAEVVVTMLNELFTILTEIVFRHNGTVDKFVGDCVMAVWGAPDDQPDHARRALAAAEDMQRWLEAGNESWRERFGFSVELAIGINTGEAVVGNFGSETRMEYTVIGDVVNVAARLEAIARPNQILVTAATRDQAGSAFRFRSLGTRELAGKAAPVTLYEVLA